LDGPVAIGRNRLLIYITSSPHFLRQCLTARHAIVRASAFTWLKRQEVREMS
jgi:hypothetical protein